MSTSFHVFDNKIGDFISLSFQFMSVRSLSLIFLFRNEGLPVSLRESFCVVSYLLGILSLSKQYRWTSTWRGLFLQIVLDSFCERSDLLGSFEEAAMIYVLRKFSTRTQLALHRFQIILRVRWFFWKSWSLLFHFSFASEWSCIFPRHKTEWTYTFAFVHFTTWLWHEVNHIQGPKRHIVVETFRISSDCSKIDLDVISNNVLSSLKLVFPYATKFSL